MKLNIVPARTGISWVRQGIQTFWRQPIALSGLFFIFMAIMALCSVLFWIGSVIALVLLPAATLGLMAATREASLGKFPMPGILVSAFRAGQQRKKDMLILGLIYASSFISIMGLSALIDGGEFARLYLLGGSINPEIIQTTEFQMAMWLTMLMYMPLSAGFWHASALVHWNGVPAVKSIFFSFMACVSNWRAFAVYMLLWLAIYGAIGFGLSIAAVLTGNSDWVSLVMLPVFLLLTAMFFTSSYFTYKDCFQTDIILA
jgi:hypothetical protein